jgi:hypothetical protein
LEEETQLLVDYHELVPAVRELVTRTTPVGSHVAVVSRGDPELLVIPDRIASHFPASPDGGFAGFYPRDGRGALEQVSAAIAAGANYLAIPETGRWWIHYYREFADYLRVASRTLADELNVGIVFELCSLPSRQHLEGSQTLVGRSATSA